MSNRYPYAPDMDAPPGIPRGYPYGPTPTPSANPLLQSLNYPSTNPAFPLGMPYPTATSSYPSTSPYPSTTTTYPPAPASSYPTTAPSYPPASSYPTAAPSYPLASSYPTTAPSYPPSSSYPTVAPSYPPASSYPSAAPSYPSATSPYPGSGMSANPSPRNAPYLSSTSCNPSFPMSYPSGNNAHSRAYPSVSPSQNYNLSGSNVVYPSHPGYPKHNTMDNFMYEGTVKPYPAFDAQQDAQALRKAMKGFGTDEKAIINVLANRSNAQRVYTGIAFKQLFGKDLIDDLKSELSGNFEDAIIALMTPTNDYLASEVHNAVSGIGTDDDTLVEVLCTRTNQEIWAINESYRRLYGKSMEDDIKSDTSGNFERLLVSTCTGARSDAPADETRATQNAHALYAAGVGQWGTDESTFNAILVAESFQQLSLTFYEYVKLAGHTVTEAIEKEMSGDLKRGMLAIARCVENRPFYFAEKLYKAMKVGLGTDDRTLIRIVVSRCELDMAQIKAEYERNYGKPLSAAIKGDTSGDYRRLLIALVDGC